MTDILIGCRYVGTMGCIGVFTATLFAQALGLDAGAVSNVTAPAIGGFQAARSGRISDGISVAPGKGWLLVIESGS